MLEKVNLRERKWDTHNSQKIILLLWQNVFKNLLHYSCKKLYIHNLPFINLHNSLHKRCGASSKHKMGDSLVFLLPLNLVELRSLPDLLSILVVIRFSVRMAWCIRRLVFLWGSTTLLLHQQTMTSTTLSPSPLSFPHFLHKYLFPNLVSLSLPCVLL